MQSSDVRESLIMMMMIKTMLLVIAVLLTQALQSRADRPTKMRVVFFVVLLLYCVSVEDVLIINHVSDTLQLSNLK